MKQYKFSTDTTVRSPDGVHCLVFQAGKSRHVPPIHEPMVIMAGGKAVEQKEPSTAKAKPKA